MNLANESDLSTSGEFFKSAQLLNSKSRPSDRLDAILGKHEEANIFCSR